MRKVLGILIIVASILLALYLGIYVMLIGGIIQLIEACKNNWETTGMIWGIAKIIFCEIPGLIAWLGIVLGTVIITYAK